MLLAVLTILLMDRTSLMVHSFTFPAQNAGARQSAHRQNGDMASTTANRIFSTSLYLSKKEIVDEPILDKNGVEFKEGSVVQIIKKGIPCYQMPAEAWGSYEDKEFVAAPPDGPRATRKLVLPMGMKGTVSKVYTKNNLSANFRVLVQFSPDDDNDFVPPVPFSAHLGSKEIECV